MWGFCFWFCIHASSSSSFLPSHPHSHSLTHPLRLTHTHTLTHTHSHSLTHPLTHSPSLTHSFTLTHCHTSHSHSSLTHHTHSHYSHSLTPSLTHSLSHSLTHARTHARTHSLALTHTHSHFAWQAWDNVHCQGVGCTPWRPLASLRGSLVSGVFAWQAWDNVCTVKGSDVRPGVPWRPPGDPWSPVLLRGRRGTMCTAKGSDVGACCQELDAHIWPKMVQEGFTWAAMLDLECSDCSQERRRRCRVITGNHNKDAHCSQKFSQAPYIHPFNQPKYQAQLNHAIVFAKSVRSKILWYLAEDWLQDSGAVASKEELQRKREKWLELHDKQTAGILGLLPLIRGMPVRFTESYNRELGAYKHATGKLIGWGISPAELARLDNDPDPEMVLRECPTFLRVKLTHPTKLEPNGLVDVRPCTRPWRRGNLQIYRRGFQIGPDFAGTAHAYCGSTLRACKGDLLHWTAPPTADSRLRAYIIRSRVRAADDLLIVQLYSPCLFRQALAKGPRLLLQRQLGEATLDEIAEAWARDDTNSTNTAASQQRKEPSWTTWTVPCRTCSDEAGEEVRWPLRCFLFNLTQQVACKHLTRGQLLQCCKCQQFRAPKQQSALIMCELCRDLVRRGRFDAITTKWWDECVPGKKNSMQTASGRVAVIAELRRQR